MDMSQRREGEIDIVDFLRVAWRRRVVVIVVTFVVALLSVAYALLATPRFRAEVVVVQVSESGMSGAGSLAGRFGSLASLAGLNLKAGGSSTSYRALLKSRFLVEQFVRRNGIAEIMSPAAAEPLSVWVAVKKFRETVLTVREEEELGVIRVSVKWSDPQQAADWANGLVALANEILRERARAESERNIRYLNEQIEENNVFELERVLYKLVEEETKSLMLANAREEYAFATVDPAVPPEIRVSPKRKLIVLSGCILGAFFAMVGLYSWELFRRVVDERSAGKSPAAAG